MNRIFIYGTLAPGRPNEHILSELEGSWQKAYVYGSLIEEGWGSKLGYPGIVLDNSDNQVNGFVFTSNKLNEKLDFLDKFEGREYKRVSTIVYLESHKQDEAYIYALNHKD